MGFRRKLERNIMKNWQKNNKISEEWQKFQIEKYSLGVYEEMQRQNKKKRR